MGDRIGAEGGRLAEQVRERCFFLWMGAAPCLQKGAWVTFSPYPFNWVPLCRSQPVLLYPWHWLGMASIGKGKRREGQWRKMLSSDLLLTYLLVDISVASAASCSCSYLLRRHHDSALSIRADCMLRIQCVSFQTY